MGDHVLTLADDEHDRLPCECHSSGQPVAGPRRYHAHPGGIISGRVRRQVGGVAGAAGRRAGGGRSSAAATASAPGDGPSGRPSRHPMTRRRHHGLHRCQRQLPSWGRPPFGSWIVTAAYPGSLTRRRDRAGVLGQRCRGRGPAAEARSRRRRRRPRCRARSSRGRRRRCRPGLVALNLGHRSRPVWMTPRADRPEQSRSAPCAPSPGSCGPRWQRSRHDAGSLHAARAAGHARPLRLQVRLPRRDRGRHARTGRGLQAVISSCSRATDAVAREGRLRHAREEVSVSEQLQAGIRRR